MSITLTKKEIPYVPINNYPFNANYKIDKNNLHFLAESGNDKKLIKIDMTNHEAIELDDESSEDNDNEDYENEEEN